jgi:pimeloyl-ACP methyl ester carboxylesterase
MTEREIEMSFVKVGLTGAAVLLAASLLTPAAEAKAPVGVKNIVLVHGAWADGSGWHAVYNILTKDGYKVSIVQEPLSSLSDDVAATKRVLAMQDGPVVLVGHSYGGVVISEAGNDPKVAGLVFIAAFELDQGESVEALSKNPMKGAPVIPLLPPQDGYLFIDKAKFHEAFAADVPAAEAQFLADAQAPWGLGAFAGTLSTPGAWKTKASWALIPGEDMMIGAPAEQFMAKRAGSTVVNIKGSHAIYVSQPKAVAALIETAATSLHPAK